MNTIYHVKTSPVALKDNIIQGEKYRIINAPRDYYKSLNPNYK